MTAKKQQVVEATDETTALTTLSDAAKAFMVAAESGGIGVTETTGLFPFPVLQICQQQGTTNDVDGEELDIEFGHFYINGLPITSSEIIFRPIGTWNKITKRAGPEDNYRVLSETGFFSDWSAERPDTTGGVDCGRVFGRDAKDLSKEEQEENKDKASVASFVFGLVEFPDVEEPILTVVRFSGGKMVRWGEASSKKVIKTEPYQRKFKIETVNPKKDPTLSKAEQQKSTGNYVNILVEPLMDTTYSTVSIAEQGGEVLQFIKRYNADIMSKHQDAVRTRRVDSGDYIDGEVIEIEDLG